MNKRIIPILSVLCALAIGLMIFSLTRQDKQSGTFTPPPFDAVAQTGTPDVPENLGYSPVKVENAFSVYVCGKVVIKGNSADVYFTNNRENTLLMKLRILDEAGNTLGETGLIKPGEYVRTLKFDTVPENGEKIKLKIMAYEPDTYYSGGSATLNTTATIGEKS